MTKLNLHSLPTGISLDPGSRINQDYGSQNSPISAQYEPIAIIGAGCRLPGANSLEELWELVSNGESKVQPLGEDRFQIQQSFRSSQNKEWFYQQNFHGNFVNDVDKFDHGFFGVSIREAAHMDPQQRLLLMVAFEALDSSGYTHHHRREDGDPVGCFIGASYTEYLENTSAYSPSAFTATGTIRAFLSGKISHHFGWTGPSEVIDTACSASLVAIHRACRAIQTKECSMALAGGVNIITGVDNYIDLAKAGFLSGTGQCKPFDHGADGYCRADGVGLIVLKSLQQAIIDGDQILGAIESSSTNQGGLNSASITVPDSAAQQALYQKALDEAHLAPDQVSYVEAHGTGTLVGDPIEINSIRQVFGGSQRVDPLYIGSLKANLGHSETAAGVAGLLKVLSMFANKSIPPLAGFHMLNPTISSLEPDRLVIPSSMAPWEIGQHRKKRIACVNGYGASGSNAALLVSEYNHPQKRHSRSYIPAAFPVLLSAASLESLTAYANSLASFLRQAPPNASLADVAFTLSQRRKHHRVRWSTQVSDLCQLSQELDTGLKDISTLSKSPKRLVLVISGQSRATIGLDPEMVQTYPLFQSYLNQCSQILKDLGHPDILPALSQTEPIVDILVLQCGTFAVQYASARCYIDAGMPVDAVVGHSLGELTALAVSGALSLKDALKLISQRTSLMKTKWSSERGTMLAVHGDLVTVQDILTAVENANKKLEIACYNSQKSHVVVGTEGAIATAEDLISHDAKFRGVRYRRVAVSHGFHSRFTEGLLADLVEFGKSLDFKRPIIPLETCTRYSQRDATQAPKYLASHSRDPVYFSEAIQRIEARLGPCVWLEAGWDTPIVNMTKKAVLNPESHTFQPATFPAQLMAALWSEGVPGTFWAFLSPTEMGLQPVSLPPYQFNLSRHWLPHVDRAIEEQRAKVQSSYSLKEGVKPKSLVTYIAAPSHVDKSHHFRIHTDTERYTKIVKGHAVCQKPLCPASVYMECAVLGVSLIGGDLRSPALSFQNICFHRGLGCDENMDVEMLLDGELNSLSSPWHFILRSSKATTHVEGDLRLITPAETDFDLYDRLVSDRIKALKNDPTLDTLKSDRAYALFSRVVEYGDILRGISWIALGTTEAVAEINVPSLTWTQPESSVSNIIEAIAIDTFIQVLGLLINSSGGPTGAREIWVATGINKMVVLPCDFGREQTWSVYAKFRNTTGHQISGDLFVFSQTGELKLIGSGIQFTKVQVAKLERLLDEVAKTVPYQEKIGPQSQREPTLSESWQKDVLRSNPIGKDEFGARFENGLRSLISSYTGVALSEIQDSESMTSMGIDSLGVIELADELQSKFGIIISTDDLLSSSMVQLLGSLSRSDIDTPSSRANSNPEPSSYLSPDIDLTTPLGRWSRYKEDSNSRHRVETLVYKEVEGIEIHADVMVPLKPPSHAMPIALMIHGGGHMTLSRKAVRPAQTACLLANGILPVSVDYRLCPQVNIIDGPMTDIRDALSWAQKTLPSTISAQGVLVDPTRVVIIGWSTGGHLAMTTAWTAPAIGLQPPVAILSFYCPTDYKPSASMMGKEYQARAMTMAEIQASIPSRPVTGHAIGTSDGSGLGWIQPGDPRSELVLALIKEEKGNSLLFHGIPDHDDLMACPDATQAASISPLAQLQAGNYHIPTFLIIGDQDEIVPFNSAVRFADALRESGVKSGFLPVLGARHVYDVGVTPETKAWELGVGPGYEFLIQQLQMPSIKILTMAKGDQL